MGQGLLTFFRAMGSFERNVRTSSQKKCINMHKIERVRFIEVKYFWGLETIKYFVACIRYTIKS